MLKYVFIFSLFHPIYLYAYYCIYIYMRIAVINPLFPLIQLNRQSNLLLSIWRMSVSSQTFACVGVWKKRWQRRRNRKLQQPYGVKVIIYIYEYCHHKPLFPLIQLNRQSNLLLSIWRMIVSSQTFACVGVWKKWWQRRRNRKLQQPYGVKVIHVRLVCRRLAFGRNVLLDLDLCEVA